MAGALPAGASLCWPGCKSVALLLTLALPSALQGIEWSTSTVLATSVASALRQGLSVAPLGTLPQLLDIDTLADLQRWVALQQQQQQQQQQNAGPIQQAPRKLRSLLVQAAQRIVQ